MPSTARVLTNDYRDCKLVKLDSHGPSSPLIVMQEGYAPGDASCRVRMFFLQRDGCWIDEIARSTRPDSEAGDVVYENAADALRVLSSIKGSPIVRNLPVTEAEIQAYKSRVGSGTAESLLKEFLARYRAANPKA